MQVKEVSNEYREGRKKSLKRGYQQSDDTDFPKIFDKIIERRHHESKDNSETTRYK